MPRCELRYFDPERRRWENCPGRVQTDTDLMVDGAPRLVCPQHRDQVRRVQRAGLTDGLRWNQAPTRSRRRSRVIPKPTRPASRGTPGQLHLVDVPAAADARTRSIIDSSRRPT
jgi:hypothetical protein